MADEKLLDKVQDLSDLELAALLCLTNQEHCIIDTDPAAMDDLVQELRLVGFRQSSLKSILSLIKLGRLRYFWPHSCRC